MQRSIGVKHLGFDTTHNGLDMNMDSFDAAVGGYRLVCLVRDPFITQMTELNYGFGCLHEYESIFMSWYGMLSDLLEAVSVDPWYPGHESV